jgi:hypothetical protein
VVLISKVVEEAGVAIYTYGQVHSKYSLLDFAHSNFQWPVLAAVLHSFTVASSQ